MTQHSMVNLIAHKRDGGTHSTDDIDWLIAAYTRGDIPDYQMAAWAMAVVLRGMDSRETSDLTLAMARSGTMLDMHDIFPITVDKHSTGGVGDKTTLVLAPMVAAAGVPVAKMSGRSLGFTGGTLDKLSTIPGLRTDLSAAAFRHTLCTTGLVISGQTDDLAPADKKLYALRDVTATVESIPLIAASVMSKKLAAGADCLVLDVKYGRGSLVGTLESARLLAQMMVEIGQHAGRSVRAFVTSMEQPLGYAVGNALELHEVIDALQGTMPADLETLCFTLGAELLCMAGRARTRDDAIVTLREVVQNGSAWQKFRDMVAAQGGDIRMLDEPHRLPRAPTVVSLPSPHAGTIESIDARALGMAVVMLGGGRTKYQMSINPAVGIVLRAKVGDSVDVGEPLLDIHAATPHDAQQIIPMLRDAYTFCACSVTPPPLIVLHVGNVEHEA